MLDQAVEMKESRGKGRTTFKISSKKNTPIPEGVFPACEIVVFYTPEGKPKSCRAKFVVSENFKLSQTHTFPFFFEDDQDDQDDQDISQKLERIIKNQIYPIFALQILSANSMISLMSRGYSLLVASTLVENVRKMTEQMNSPSQILDIQVMTQQMLIKHSHPEIEKDFNDFMCGK